MEWHKITIEVQTNGKGMYDFTRLVQDAIHKWGMKEGLCILFIQHTSASLAIGESYDPTARVDIEEFLERLVPENETWYRHTSEGADDSTSHIRSILTGPSLTIPVDDGRLSLGTWQGLYLFEHRNHPHRRSVLVRGLRVV